MESTSIAVKKKPKLSDKSHDESHVDIPIQDSNVPSNSHINKNAGPSQNFSNGKLVNAVMNFELKRKLIVYTTRLDQMSIIVRPPNKNKPILFFSKILDESLPLIKTKSVKDTGINDKKPDPLSYLTLKYKIDKINKNIQRQVGWIKRSEINEMRNLECELTDDLSGNKFINKFKEIFTLKKKYEKKGSSEIKISTKNNKAGLDFCRNIIIFKNINRYELNIYHIDGTGCITQHYQTKAKMHKFIKRTPKTVDIVYCCWHRHRAILSLMSAFLPAVTVKYMLQPHNCLRQCTCCCKNKPGMSDKPTNSTATIFRKTCEGTTTAAIADIDMETNVTLLAPKVLEKNMLNELSRTNLIQKAFAHTLYKKPRLKNNTSEVDEMISFKETQILFNYDNGNDYYRLGLEGEIIQHFRNVSQTFIEERVMNGEKTINEKVCCSIERDKLIYSFSKNKMRLETYKYIKTRSKLLDKAQCHCKPLQPSPNITSVTFKKLNLTDVPNYTRECTYKMPPIQFMFAKHVPTVAKHVVRTDSTEDKIQTIPTGASTGPSVDKIPVQNINNEHNKHVCVVSNYTNDEEQRRMLICIDTKNLLENSLDRLNNISVVINDQSKITVTLNIPITDLTTNEVKTLSVILNQAQKEVDNLRQEVVFNKVHNNAAKNVARPTYLSPVASNNIIDKIQTSKCSSHMKDILYAQFSLLSGTYNAGYVKSLKSFLKTKYSNKLVTTLQSSTRKVDNRGSTTIQTPRRRRKQSNDATEQTDKELQKKKPRLTGRAKKTARDQITEMQEEPETELSEEECLREETPDIFQPAVIENNNIKSEIQERIPVSQDDVDPIGTIDFDPNNVKTEGGTFVFKNENQEDSATVPDDDDCILGI